MYVCFLMLFCRWVIPLRTATLNSECKNYCMSFLLPNLMEEISPNPSAIGANTYKFSSACNS